MDSLVLWKPNDLFVYISNTCENEENNEINHHSVNQNQVDFEIEIVVRNESSAFMNIKNGGLVGMSFILDLLTTIIKLGEARNERGELMYFLYAYTRLDFATNFEVMPLSEDYATNIVVLEFIFGQYSFFKNIDDEHTIDLHRSDQPIPNIVARGLENTGVGIRLLLKTSGRCLGDSIRYMGPILTSARLKLNGASGGQTASEPSESSSSSLSSVVKQSAVDRALSVRSGAESMHAGASKITSTILLPVRWIGRQAAKLSNLRGLDSSSNPITKVAFETVCGLGNGVTNVLKGVTEMLAEVGSAVGDCTMHHSSAVNGPLYANEITRHYVEAFGQMSRAGYKLTNVASVGINGLMLDAVVEGATQYMSLYDYLIGPVLLQGTVELQSQVPFARPETFFAVLRPWSLAFYKSPVDFIHRPHKIIPTCMLDTLPQLHLAEPPSISSSSTNNNNIVDEPEEESKAEEDTTLTSTTSKNAPERSILGIEDRTSISSSSSEQYLQTPAHLSRRESFFKSLMNDGGSGIRAHIELCTVDCSTFLLFPPEHQLQIWFDEIRAACSRVETVKMRRSGAEQLSTRRRLDLLPRSTLVIARVKELILSSNTAALSQLTEFDNDLNESSVGFRQGTLSATIVEGHSVGNDESVASESFDGDVDESEFDAFFEDILEDLTVRSHDSSDFVSVARRVPIGEGPTAGVETVTTTVLGEGDRSIEQSEIRHLEDRATTASTAEVQASPLLSSSCRSAIDNNSHGAVGTGNRPSMLTRARHSFGRLMDPLVNSVVTAVRIQITPLTYSGTTLKLII